LILVATEVLRHVRCGGEHVYQQRISVGLEERMIMTVRETSDFKINPEHFKSDRSLREDRGWHDMDVQWLVTKETVGSTMTVVGLTRMPPGGKSKHAMHRHPNAEEWEYIIQGTGLKHVGEESFHLKAGELSFVPRNVYHGLENPSETETLVSIWGYCGASSLEEAGYVILQDDEAEARSAISK
jgi:mannose-6-phosphate isomerase-like protein (cupin superfamily)